MFMRPDVRVSRLALLGAVAGSNLAKNELRNRSRNPLVFFASMTPSSQELGPPANPGRFNLPD